MAKFYILVGTNTSVVLPKGYATKVEANVAHFHFEAMSSQLNLWATQFIAAISEWVKENPQEWLGFDADERWVAAYQEETTRIRKAFLERLRPEVREWLDSGNYRSVFEIREITVD